MLTGECAARRFCFERALKLACWSKLMYEYRERPEEQYTFPLDQVMGLYDSNCMELFWEKSLDTQVG